MSFAAEQVASSLPNDRRIDPLWRKSNLHDWRLPRLPRGATGGTIRASGVAQALTDEQPRPSLDGQ